MPMASEPSNFEANVTRKRKAGRPALPGNRYPSGQLKPAGKRDAGAAPALIKRAFDGALRGAGDPLLGTSLGLLFMTGKITASELAAGNAFAKLWGRYDRAMGMPGRFTMSPDYGTARAPSSREPLSDAAVTAVKDRLDKTLALLGGTAHAGGTHDARRTVALLERVCVDDLACEGYELPRLKAALDLLVPWFGIEAREGS